MNDSNTLRLSQSQFKHKYWCAVKEYLNAIFDQYHRLKFKNRMFSLRNDLLSQFCVLFANSSLAANDFVDNSILLDIKQSKCQELICIFPVPFQITTDVILFLSCIKTQISFQLQETPPKLCIFTVFFLRKRRTLHNKLLPN